MGNFYNKIMKISSNEKRRRTRLNDHIEYVKSRIEYYAKNGEREYCSYNVASDIITETADFFTKDGFTVEIIDGYSGQNIIIHW